MKLNTNFFRIRLTMILAPIATVFFLCLCFKFILPNYLATTKDLFTDHGIIQSIYPNEETKKVLLNTSHHGCLDIKLYDRKYIIRLSDKFKENKWAIIYNANNINKEIEIKKLHNFPNDGIVYNPNELSIDNKIIIHFNNDKTIILWCLIGSLIVGLLFGFTSCLAIKTYIEDNLSGDKADYKKGLSKLIRVWINDWMSI